MTKVIDAVEQWPTLSRVALSFVALAVVGVVDYAAGYELLFSAFYLLPVLIGTWFVGRWFGVLLSLLSVGISQVGDVFAGAAYSSALIPVWNTIIVFSFNMVVVWLTSYIRGLHNLLEDRVRERTGALTREMAKREALESEIINISEREQQRISSDLHDVLCQHLTGTALAGQVLTDKLMENGRVEAVEAGHVVDLVEEGIALARNLVRGLHPLRLEGEGFVDALRELTTGISERFKVECSFSCNSRINVRNTTVSMHLYRIAQEALMNAVKHGKPKHIAMELTLENGAVVLTVRDDGTGLPEHPEQRAGAGLQIMNHRAAMIGASFTARKHPAGGTVVTCSLTGRGISQ